MLEVHPFRPFLDPWPPMAPKVPLNPARRSFGQVPAQSSVPADENRIASRAELDAANKAIRGYADRLDYFDQQFAKLKSRFWQQWEDNTFSSFYSDVFFGPDQMNELDADWTATMEQSRAVLAQLGDETLYGVSVVGGRQAPVTVGRLRQIYGFLAGNASAMQASIVYLGASLPDSVLGAFWTRIGKEAGDWAQAFKELADGLRDLIAGVGQLAQGAAAGIGAVGWFAPALVVAGVGFFLWLKASEARKRAGV